MLGNPIYESLWIWICLVTARWILSSVQLHSVPLLFSQIFELFPLSSESVLRSINYLDGTYSISSAQLTRVNPRDRSTNRFGEGWWLVNAAIGLLWFGRLQKATRIIVTESTALCYKAFLMFFRYLHTLLYPLFTVLDSIFLKQFPITTKTE